MELSYGLYISRLYSAGLMYFPVSPFSLPTPFFIRNNVSALSPGIKTSVFENSDLANSLQVGLLSTFKTYVWFLSVKF